MTEQILTWPTVLGVVVDGGDLTQEQAQWAMNEIMTDSATSAQIATLGVAIKMKGAAPQELSGFAETMLAHSVAVAAPEGAVDIVGTGGDRSFTVNISTMTAIVVAAVGVPVVKHGNRAASSKSGGADVLEALGVNIELTADAVEACINQVGIGYCFAPMFHPALRFAGPARREIGVPTVFNVLGPLTNPAQPRYGLIGCAFADLAPVMAETFATRGASVLVVRGNDGLDELTTTGTSTIWRVTGGVVDEVQFHPGEVGIELAKLSALQGGDAQENAHVAHELFAGKRGAVRDAVVLNAAAAVASTRGLDGELTQLIAKCISEVERAIDSGAAADLLAQWAQFSQTV